MKKKEQEELTFKPRTNETRNREVLQQIMYEERGARQMQQMSRGLSGSPDERNMRDELNRYMGSQATSYKDLRARNPNEE